MKNKSFAVFIVSNNRPEVQKTLELLKDRNYSGDWYIVLDNLDKTINKYIENYGEEHIIVFNKVKEEERTDLVISKGNPDKYKSVLYSRNFVQRKAKELGYDYIFMTDDDHLNFRYRYNENGTLKGKDVKDIEKVFDLYIDYLKSTPHLYSLGFALGAIFIGGVENINSGNIPIGVYGNCFMETKKPIEFFSLINEDLNTVLREVKLGRLQYSPPFIHLGTTETNTEDGGMTDLYNMGHYVRSSYSIVTAPNICHIRVDGKGKMVLIKKWKISTPKIISEKLKKVEK